MEKTFDSSQARMAAMRTAQNQKRADRQLLTESIAPDVTVRKDSPPGVGWILERKGKPNKYLATKEQAVAHYRELLARELVENSKSTVEN